MLFTFSSNSARLFFTASNLLRPPVSKFCSNQSIKWMIDWWAYLSLDCVPPLEVASQVLVWWFEGVSWTCPPHSQGHSPTRCAQSLTLEKSLETALTFPPCWMTFSMKAATKSLTCRDDASVPAQSFWLVVGRDSKPSTCLRSKAASPVQPSRRQCHRQQQQQQNQNHEGQW